MFYDSRMRARRGSEEMFYDSRMRARRGSSDSLALCHEHSVFRQNILSFREKISLKPEREDFLVFFGLIVLKKQNFTPAIAPEYCRFLCQKQTKEYSLTETSGVLVHWCTSKTFLKKVVFCNWSNLFTCQLSFLFYNTRATHARGIDGRKNGSDWG